MFFSFSKSNALSCLSFHSFMEILQNLYVGGKLCPQARQHQGDDCSAGEIMSSIFSNERHYNKIAAKNNSGVAQCALVLL
jgi:hypothetical protein